MKEYFKGFYCRDELHLQIINKDSNRKILDALRSAYPKALSVEDLAKKSQLPVKTVYAQKAELFREYFIEHYEDQEDEEESSRRGRPSSRISEEDIVKSRGTRTPIKIMIEETGGIHDPYHGRKPIPLPPGRFLYADGFEKAFERIMSSDELEDLNNILIRCVEKVLGRVQDYDQDFSRKSRRVWAPERGIKFCCNKCGLNHQVRDFIRAVLLNILDQFEDSNRFVTFLNENGFLTKQAFEKIVDVRKKERDSV